MIKIKKEIKARVETLENGTVNKFGKYQITINGISFDNWSGHRNEVVSFPEGNFDTKLTIYIYGKTLNFPGIQINAETKEQFIDAVYRIVNKKHKFYNP